MPKVPQIQQQATTAAGPSGMLPLVHTPDEFGAALGRGVSSAAKDVSDVRVRAQNDANQIAIDDARVRMGTWENDFLYHPETGALNKRGRDAFPLADQSVTEFDKIASRIEGDLTNGAQKQLFRQHADAKRVAVERTVYGHIEREQQAYDEQSFKALQENSRQAVAANYRDLDRVHDEIDSQVKSIHAFAERNGMDPEVRKAYVQEAMSGSYETVVRRTLASGDSSTARALYQEMKPMILGERREGLERDIEQGGIVADSQAAADDILAQVVRADGNVSKLDAGAARRLVREIKDPQLRDATQARVEKRMHEFDDTQAREQEAAFSEVIADAQEHGNLTEAGMQSLLRLTPEHRAKALDLITGGPVKTDFAVYDELKRQAAIDPDEFAAKRLALEYRSHLGDTELKELITLQGSLRGEGGREAAVGLRTHFQVVDGTIAASGFDPTPDPVKSPEDAARINTLRRMVDDRVIGWKQANGKTHIPSDEVQQIVDTLLIQYRTNRASWWRDAIPFGFVGNADTVKHAFELTPGDLALDQIPQERREYYRRNLEARGRVVTDDDLKALYLIELRDGHAGRR